MRKLLPIFALLIAPYASAQDFNKGMMAYGDNDYGTALQEWLPLAEQGNSLAQFFLGEMYIMGQGVPQDYEAAVQWWTLAAEEGHSGAQYELGRIYSNGYGVRRDYKEAVKWYTLAAEQGYSSAQIDLGAMYADGTGVLQDYIRAHMWWNIASARGYDGARKNRDKIAEMMTPEQMEKAQVLAKECVRKNYKGC